MKKVVFCILALVFAIALVAGGYLLFTSLSLQKYSVEEGVPCPYSWQELRNGTYRLQLDISAYPDGNWTVDYYPKNVVAVAKTNSEPGTAAFSILPLNMGQTYVSVYCEQTTLLPVRVFEINLQIQVSEELEISIEQTDHTIYDGIATLGESSDTPIQWWANPNGLVNLLISEESSWTAADYDTDSLGITGPFYRDGSCGFEIQGKQAGTFPLTLHDNTSRMLLLEVKVTEELAASIVSFSADTHVPDKSEEHTALESAVGCTLVLPQQAVAREYAVKSSKGIIGFLLKEQSWYWHISTNGAEEPLLGDITLNAKVTKTASDKGITLTTYQFSDGIAVSWSDGIHAMALYGQREATPDDILSIALELLEANHG